MEQVTALAQLDELHPRITETLDDPAGRVTTSMRLVAAAARAWWIRGRGPSVQPAVEAMLRASTDGVEPALVAASRQGAGELAYARADYGAARDLLGRAARLGAEHDHRWIEATAVNWLGMVDREQGRYAEAEARHARAESLYAQTDDASPWGRAHALSNQGVVAYRRDDLPRAQALHERALALRVEIDDLHGLASTQGNLALIHRTRGALDEAGRLYRRSLEARERLGDRWGVAGSSVCLAQVERARGDLPAARQYLRAAVAGFVEVGDMLGIAESAEAAAQIHQQARAPDEAAGALAIADAVRRVIEAPTPDAERARRQSTREHLRGVLGDAVMRAHDRWAAQATLTDAIARLLSSAGSPSDDK